VEWRDDWPVIGEDQGNGKGQPVLIHRKPFLPVQPISSPPGGDEFQATKTGPQWQWQANPREEWFSLVEKPGSLRLKAIRRPSSNLWEAPYLFLQKFPAPLFSATAQIALVSEKPGDRAGLIVFGSDYAWIGIRRTPDGFEIVQSLCKDAVKGGAEKMNSGIPIPSGTAFLRVTVREGGRCRFSYSLDGNTYTELGPEFNSRPGRWVGAKVGLFCDSEAEGSKGCADVSWFRISGP
jgi:beta-xylosidase